MSLKNNEPTEKELIVSIVRSFYKSPAYRIAPYFAVMIVSLIGAIIFRDSMFFFMITGISVCTAAAIFCIGKTLENIFSKEPLEAAADVQAAVAFIAIGGIILGVLATAERIIWANVDNVPSILISEDFTKNKKKFDVNQYRLLRMNCRDRNSAMELRDTDLYVYARCGMWYPSTRLVKVDKGAFVAAQDAAMKVPDSEPITLPPVQVQE